jgi:hypothetical protein
VVTGLPEEAAMRRVSILGLMGCVFACAVALAALRNASELWAGITLLIALGALGTALLGVIYQQGKDRAWWLGFALFGGGYLTLAFAPWFSEEVGLKLATTQLLGYLHSQVTQSPTPQPTFFLDSTGKRTALRDLKVERDSVATKLQNARRLTKNPNSDPSVLRLRRSLASLDQQISIIEGVEPFSLSLWAAPGGPATASDNRWQALLPGAANYDPFLRVGHSVFAVLAGLVGAVIACRFQARRERREAAGVHGIVG